MTEEEFVAWCDEDIKAEWVNGEVIVHSPTSIKHADLVGLLNFVMRGLAIQRDSGMVLGPEVQIRLKAQRIRRVPDLLFLTKERKNLVKTNHIEGSPDLVVEITSPDSLARDWREKYLEYETAGVREYWVIDPMSQRVEAYVLGEDKRFRQIEETEGTIRSSVLEGFYLRLAWLWQEPLPNPLVILRELGVIQDQVA